MLATKRIAKGKGIDLKYGRVCRVGGEGVGGGSLLEGKAVRHLRRTEGDKLHLLQILQGVSLDHLSYPGLESQLMNVLAFKAILEKGHHV